jgi:DnaJ like chaperone protein
LYWGKIIGGLVGLATLKPLLVLAGIFLGHQFDRGFRRFADEGTDVGRVSDGFVRALFQAMGHLAKTDGRVTEDEIRAARMVMHRLGLGPAQVRRAMHWFDEGKRPGFPLVQTVRELRRVSGRSAAHRALFLRLLLEVALSKDSLKRDERARIWTVCQELDIGRVELAQLEAMIRAQKGFRHSPAEIKKAYRRLMNRNHPDKISGSNPDAAVLAEAERRTREVRGAYEMLKARRSIR